MTARYNSILSFTDALANWSGKALNAIPADRAPCGFVTGDADGENRILASLFAYLCAEEPSRRMLLLLTAIEAHRYRLDRMVEAFGGKSDVTTPFNRADRELAVRSRPYRAMIDGMRCWLDELHQASTDEIGIRFIDEAARTRIAS